MSKPGSPQTTYLAGDDPETIAANRAYQEALARLTDSLNSRKNRLFDPVLLAVAQGFLAPTQTGSFSEALGNVAAKLGPAEAAAFKERQELEEQRLMLASRGLELQRQRSRDAMARRALAGDEDGALAEPGAGPAQGALAQARGASGQERGFQIAPPVPGVSRRQFFELGLADGKNLSDITKEWEAIVRGRQQTKEGFLIDTSRGRAYAFPTGKLEEVQIFDPDGSAQTYRVSANVAAELSELARAGDSDAYFALAARVKGGPRARPAAQSAAAQPAAPGAAAQPATLPPPVAAQAAAPVVPAAVSAAVPAAPVVPAAAQAAAVPPAAPQAPAVPPAARPAAPVVAPAAELVGGMFTPPTKNADNPRIGQMVEYYKNNLAVASGLPLNRGEPFSPEVINRAQEEADATLKRLEENFGMRLAPAQPSRAQAAPAQVAAQAAPRVQPPVAQPAAPAQAATAAPPQRTGLRSQEQISAERRQSEIDQAAETERRKKLADAAAAKEAALEANDRAARNTYQSASKILDYVKQSPNFFGIFSRPGVVSAIGGFIEQGLRTPTGTIDLPGFRESITKLMPNVRQQDLDNVMLAAAELAEIELNFSRQYFQGQGAVTENERKIVRAIPGSVSSSPRVLRARMELLRDRAQYDIDVADAFRDWQKNHPGRSYLDFERDSQLYKDIKKDFDTKAAKIYNGLPAIPSRERARGTGAAPQAQAAGAQPSTGFIRDPNTGVIRRKKPGE